MPHADGSEARGAEPRVFSPFCAHLRTKKAYFLRAPARTEADILDGSGHCWCRHTMTILGPGGAIADPSDCRAGRACYEPAAGPRP